MDTSQPRRLRLWIPGLLLAIYAGLLAWSRSSESMIAPMIYFSASIFLVVLFWLWWCFLSGLKPLARWMSLFAGLVLIGFLAMSLRYQGSTSGTGVPQFVWKWSPSLDERISPTLASPPAEAALEVGASPLKYAAVDSPEYYGPKRNGTIDYLKIPSAALENAPELIWKHGIGLGWSSFAVSGRIAVTQEQRGDEEWVTAYDLETGELNWSYAQNRRFSEAMGGDGPRATPSIANGVVYALGGTGALDALSLTNGTSLWSYEALPDGNGNLDWGKSASPLYLDEENLVIVTGGTSGPTVQAVNAQNGESSWTWGTDAASYASPIITMIHGERQVVVVNENTVVGLAPDSGELKWSFDWPRGMMASTAKAGQPNVIEDDKILITASYGIGSILFGIIKGDDDTFSTTMLWHSKGRMKTKFSSACVRDNHAYGLDEGMLACIELESGKRLWKDGRYGFGQNLLVDDTLLIQAENGDIVFVAADPTGFNQLARFDGISGKTWNVPTLAGEYLLLRNDQEAACYRLPVTSPVTSIEP